MTEYFLNLLKSLYRIAGLRQMENLYAEGKEKGDRELNLLINELTHAASQYPEVPNQVIIDTINDRVRKDQEFTSLNARTIHKWLTPLRSRYYHESHHIEQKPIEDAPPIVTGKKRDEYIHQLLEICEGIGGPKKSPKDIINTPSPSMDRGPACPPEASGRRRGSEERTRYKSPYTPEQLALKEMILAARVAYYKGKPVRPDDFQTFEVDGVPIFCATLEDAKEILKLCQAEPVEADNTTNQQEQ